MLSALDQMLTQMHDEVNYVRTVKKNSNGHKNVLMKVMNCRLTQDLMDKIVVWEEKIINLNKKPFKM